MHKICIRYTAYRKHILVLRQLFTSCSINLNYKYKILYYKHNGTIGKNIIDAWNKVVTLWVYQGIAKILHGAAIIKRIETLSCTEFNNRIKLFCVFEEALKYLT